MDLLLDISAIFPKLSNHFNKMFTFECKCICIFFYLYTLVSDHLAVAARVKETSFLSFLSFSLIEHLQWR